MEASGLFNSVLRVKQEPVDVSLREHDDRDAIGKIPDHDNIQISKFLLKNQTCKLEKFDENPETKLDEDLQIVSECQDVKPTWNFSAVEKIENKTTVKVETLGSVKKEFIVDEAEKCMNFDCELGERSQERNVTKDFNIGDKRKVRSTTVHSGIEYNCDICGKTYGRKYYLKQHIDSVHKKITHTCDKCEKSFTYKSNLNTHIDVIHNGNIKHACEICGKKFSAKSQLNRHVDMVHKEILHECDVCGKKFSSKSYLKCHVDIVHKEILHEFLLKNQNINLKTCNDNQEIEHDDDQENVFTRQDDLGVANRQNNVAALRDIRAMADRIQLPENTIVRANDLFTTLYENQTLKRSLSNKYKIHTITSTCLYIACRQERVPRTYKEVSAVSGISVMKIGQCFKFIESKLKIKIKTFRAEDFVSRVCAQLGLPDTVLGAATIIARRAEDGGYFVGRSPISITAAAIYMVCQASAYKKTGPSEIDTEIYHFTGVSNVTIIGIYRLMLPHAAQLFPQDFEFATPIDRLPTRRRKLVKK